MDITLALGGGGARGNAHIGVIRRLEKEGFLIRAVAGTSFGGIVAALYAAGYSPAEIEDSFAAVDQTRLYGRQAGEGASLLGLAGVRKWLDGVLGERTFQSLRIPCALTAVDLNQAREIVIKKGRVKDAVLATIALPGIFPTYRLDDYELVDGGVLDPVPVAVARSLAPRLPVVAVVLTPPLASPSHASFGVSLPGAIPAPVIRRLAHLRLAQAFEIFMRSVEVGSRAMTALRLQVDDPEVIIRPDVSNVGLLDRVDVHRVAPLGEQAVEAVLPELRRVVAWPTRLRRRMQRLIAP